MKRPVCQQCHNPLARVGRKRNGMIRWRCTWCRKGWKAEIEVEALVMQQEEIALDTVRGSLEAAF